MHMLKVDGELFFCMHILSLARREKMALYKFKLVMQPWMCYHLLEPTLGRFKYIFALFSCFTRYILSAHLSSIKAASESEGQKASGACHVNIVQLWSECYCVLLEMR